MSIVKTINPYTIKHSDTTVSERFLKNKLQFNEPFHNKHKALELYDTIDRNSPYSLTYATGTIINIKA